MFKKVKSKNIRQKICLDDDDSSNDERESLSARLSETKELFKIRKKTSGVTPRDLLLGKGKNNKKEEDNDPYKTKSGGMLDLNIMKNAQKVDDAYDTGIGTAFSAETNRRDEDAQMQKFIEENLAIRKGVEKESENTVEDPKYLSPEESALQSVPEYLRKSSSKKCEEMLSNQMLSGIPEVDLGLEAKIRNIERTEDAKQILAHANASKSLAPSEFVPKNITVNFTQHNRFNIVDNVKRDNRRPRPRTQEVVEPVVGGGVKISTVAPKRATDSKATDDFHYEKFRKQFRRH